jgi:pimeloyl-ACP methyl ester carboxylesterase
MLYAKDLAGKWRRPKVKLKITNRSDRTLHCALVGLTQTYAVQSGLLPSGSVRLDPGQEAWANSGRPISTKVPDALWKDGLIEIRDVLKLIVSTEEIDATLLEQGELDYPLEERGVRAAVGTRSTLGRLMKRVQTRDFSTNPDDDEIISDWGTHEFTFTTVRPLESTDIPRAASAELYPGVKLLGHPTLAGKARLTATPVASRDVAGGFVLPPLLRDDPEVSQPFALSSSRGGAPGLSVLELFDVQNHETVTPEQPLRLELAQPLAAGEHLLAVTHDGEFYLPVGRGIARDGQVEVVLDALPQPQNTRSLFGAVRIYFQKVLSQHFGTQYKYPLLAAFDPATEGGSGRITEDAAALKAKVANANRIVLYIHGIIGETRGMAASSLGLAGPPKTPGLHDRYDLILTFDYENLHTSIEENARLLKQRLAEAGLAAGHGKTLHIIAHSMGGLISRWFIEREGGNEITQHLVMLGTPNGGSPWSTVEDWAITALALGLNGLTAFAWPAKVLGGLVAAVEKIDVALDQMHPGSEFLKTLHASPDPKVPYTIIAGSTSLISPSAVKDRARRSLLDRLKSLKLLHLATAPLFFGEANDIAVSVANIRRQPTGRVPAPTVREVACDHLTYFNTEGSLRELATQLQDPTKL